MNLRCYSGSPYMGVWCLAESKTLKTDWWEVAYWCEEMLDVRKPKPKTWTHNEQD